MLKRLQDKVGNTAKRTRSRLEIPTPEIIWVGKNTIFRNFMDFPKALRRDPEKFLLYHWPLHQGLCSVPSMWEPRHTYWKDQAKGRIFDLRGLWRQVINKGQLCLVLGLTYRQEVVAVKGFFIQARTTTRTTTDMSFWYDGLICAFISWKKLNYLFPGYIVPACGMLVDDRGTYSNFIANVAYYFHAS